MGYQDALSLTEGEIISMIHAMVEARRVIFPNESN